jgi:hypothetical protein
MFRRIGWMTATTVSWQHRGSLVRAGDLLWRLPGLLRDRQTGDLLTEAKVLLALDASAPTRTDIRLAGIDEGDVVLRGRVTPESLDLTRRAIHRVSGIQEIRADGYPAVAIDTPSPAVASA